MKKIIALINILSIISILLTGCGHQKFSSNAISDENGAYKNKYNHYVFVDDPLTDYPTLKGLKWGSTVEDALKVLGLKEEDVKLEHYPSDNKAFADMSFKQLGIEEDLTLFNQPVGLGLTFSGYKDDFNLSAVSIICKNDDSINAVLDYFNSFYPDNTYTIDDLKNSTEDVLIYTGELEYKYFDADSYDRYMQYNVDIIPKGTTDEQKAAMLHGITALIQNNYKSTIFKSEDGYVFETVIPKVAIAD